MYADTKMDKKDQLPVINEVTKYHINWYKHCYYIVKSCDLIIINSATKSKETRNKILERENILA